ncbi:MAG: hypothetical protein DRN04_13025 [Thermoprotei archaeon]|nr:MAG: hypothetical protein DRN04_13025 [Thermoprotei archaeon]
MSGEVELLKAFYNLRNIFYPVQLTVETKIDSHKVTIKVQGKTTSEALEKLEEVENKLKQKYQQENNLNLKHRSFEAKRHK